MKAEKVILSFIAVIIGLVAAGVAFYFYQMTKTLPPQKNQPMTIVETKKMTPPTPTPDKSALLTIESPKEEVVLTKKIVTVSGKTDSNATIVVSSEESDQVVTPAANGDFSVTQTVPNGTSVLQITAIFPNGEEKK